MINEWALYNDFLWNVFISYMIANILVGVLYFNCLQTFCDIKDLSYTKEQVPISCVNGLTRDYPDYVEYSNQRIPAHGVTLNLDENFLVGCDCTDGCRVSYNIMNVL